jgi:hypothetical protein
MFIINNEDQVNDNDNNIFLSDITCSLVMGDNEINDNMKLLIFNKDM